MQKAHLFFFFNDTATTEIYTLSLHDALPIYALRPRPPDAAVVRDPDHPCARHRRWMQRAVRSRRSEEHTSELQSQSNLVCRLLLEKKKNFTARRPDDRPRNPSSASPIRYPKA